ncbi:MAG TPA: hypothetical protein VGQ69_08295 [Gemmatimonadales bacterium]|jgi:hypothetical protein|nr:hypothetical protein [Gemmatimonadales bacterium]
MADVSIGDHLSRLNLTLQALEARAARGAMPVEELSDVKRVLDDLRLRLWALLRAAHVEDPAGFEERFRVRRATELNVRLAADLRAGLMNPRHTEFADLWIAATDLSQAVHAARTQPDGEA